MGIDITMIMIAMVTASYRARRKHPAFPSSALCSIVRSFRQLGLYVVGGGTIMGRDSFTCRDGESGVSGLHVLVIPYHGFEFPFASTLMKTSLECCLEVC